MLVSNMPEAIKKARFWATQSRENEIYYQHKEVGYNYRMSNVVAGIGRGQMKSLDSYSQKKKWIYDYYCLNLKDILEISMNPYLMNSEPNFWLSCIKINASSSVKPQHIMEALSNENIESRPIWKPMHLQPLYEDCGFIYLEKPISDDIFETGLCLPSDIKNTEDDMKRIVGIIRKCFGK